MFDLKINTYNQEISLDPNIFISMFIKSILFIQHLLELTQGLILWQATMTKKKSILKGKNLAQDHTHTGGTLLLIADWVQNEEKVKKTLRRE